MNYPYSVALYPGLVDKSQLLRAIEASDIGAAFHSTQILGGTCTIFFNADLSVDEQATLDAIVASLPPPEPVELDGKRAVLPNIFQDDLDLHFPGEGDLVNQLGGGAAFQLSSDATGDDKIVSWSFRDWVYTAGGVITYTGAVLGDTLSFAIDAPASVVTPNPGAGDCILVDTGLGFNAILPAAGDGSHDLTTPRPVPAKGGDGYWDWSTPDTGLGTMSPNLEGAGAYHLYDAAVPIVSWLRRMPLLGSNLIDYKLPAIKPKRVLPHWTWTATLQTATANPLIRLCWVLFTARKTTV